MHIYRVEIPESGRGLYRDMNAVAILSKESSYDDPRHPPPCDDALLSPIWDQLYEEEVRSDYQFGFTSIAQLKSWIYSTRMREGIDALGFKVVHFEASGYAGDTQCIYESITRGPTLSIKALTEL